MSKISEILTWPLRLGRKELIAHLEETALNRGQAMVAKCYECMGGYPDGAVDCLVPACPLYGFMPYRNKKVKDVQKKVRKTKTISPEHVKALQEGKRKKKIATAFVQKDASENSDVFDGFGD